MNVTDTMIQAAIDTFGMQPSWSAMKKALEAALSVGAQDERAVARPLGYITADAAAVLAKFEGIAAFKSVAVTVFSQTNEILVPIYTHPTPTVGAQVRPVREEWTHQKVAEFMCIAMRHAEYKKGRDPSTQDVMDAFIAMGIPAPNGVVDRENGT